MRHRHGHQGTGRRGRGGFARTLRQTVLGDGITNTQPHACARGMGRCCTVNTRCWPRGNGSPMTFACAFVVPRRMGPRGALGPIGGGRDRGAIPVSQRHRRTQWTPQQQPPALGHAAGTCMFGVHGNQAGGGAGGGGGYGQPQRPSQSPWAQRPMRHSLPLFCSAEDDKFHFPSNGTASELGCG